MTALPLPAASPSTPPSAMRRWRGLTEIGGDAYAQISTRIHDFHRAIARQPFAVLGAIPALRQAVQPVRIAHDGITDAVYLGVREIGALVFKTAESGLRAAEQLALALAPATPHAGVDAVASALGGAFGDHLAARRNPLAPRAGFYVDGTRITMRTDALRAAYPQAQSRLVVFAHGLCCNEHSWQLYRDPAQPLTRSYGEQMTDAGYSALYLRYNTGTHISHNARRLSRLMRQLAAQWPVAIEEIVLVGHSMGGLVVRAAVADAMQRDEGWTNAVHHVICLGSPHRGAALEKIAHGAAQALKAFELSRAWGEALEMRSVGIRDLRFGATSAADWRDEWKPAQTIARLAHARYHFIGSSIGVDHADWRGRLLGDGLVHLPSSLAGELADADTAVLFGKHHMQLLNDPQVYALLAERLGIAAAI